MNKMKKMKSMFIACVFSLLFSTTAVMAAGGSFVSLSSYQSGAGGIYDGVGGIVNIAGQAEMSGLSQQGNVGIVSNIVSQFVGQMAVAGGAAGVNVDLGSQIDSVADQNRYSVETQSYSSMTAQSVGNATSLVSGYITASGSAGR